MILFYFYLIHTYFRSKHLNGTYLAPYGDFDIDLNTHEMREANFRFKLVSSDFDSAIFSIHSIVDNFNKIKTLSPFLSDGHEGPFLS